MKTNWLILKLAQIIFAPLLNDMAIYQASATAFCLFDCRLPKQGDKVDDITPLAKAQNQKKAKKTAKPRNHIIRPATNSFPPH